MYFIHIIHVFHTYQPNNVSEDATKNINELVLRARQKKCLNQADFGALFGKSQGEVSRYESGEVRPPPDVLMHCMHELGLVAAPEPDVSAFELSKLIQKNLGGKKHHSTRRLLHELIRRLM